MTVLAPFLQFIMIYKYSALFAIIFTGSLLPIFLPLNEIILALSALSNQGIFSPWIIFWTSLIANVIADVVGYSLAFMYGDLVFRKLHIKKDEKFYKAEKSLNNYAYGTIFFSKIVGPFGPMVNLAAGLIKLPLRKFLTFDILGNFTDVLIFTVAGTYLGNHWEDFRSHYGTLALIAIAAFLSYVLYKSKYRTNGNGNQHMEK